MIEHVGYLQIMDHFSKQILPSVCKVEDIKQQKTVISIENALNML
jgi:hypothetical protein